MSNISITSIDNKIEELINDVTKYNFIDLKDKVEKILRSEDVFLNNNQLDTKAFDMYFNIVITRRNKLEKKEDKKRLKIDSEMTKYDLIEQICKKLEFNSNEEVIKKVEELENKSFSQLNIINENL